MVLWGLFVTGTPLTLAEYDSSMRMWCHAHGGFTEGRPCLATCQLQSHIRVGGLYCSRIAAFKLAQPRVSLACTVLTLQSPCTGQQLVGCHLQDHDMLLLVTASWAGTTSCLQVSPCIELAMT